MKRWYRKLSDCMPYLILIIAATLLERDFLKTFDVESRHSRPLVAAPSCCEVFADSGTDPLVLSVNFIRSSK